MVLELAKGLLTIYRYRVDILAVYTIGQALKRYITLQLTYPHKVGLS